jgi:hypothetical protein
MFRAHVLIIRRSKLHYTTTGFITPIGVMIPEEVYFMPLHGSSTCAHHQEVKIALNNHWEHHTYKCDDTRGSLFHALRVSSTRVHHQEVKTALNNFAILTS